MNKLFKITSTTLIFTVFASLLILPLSLSQAQSSASPSAEPTDEEVLENIQERIKQVVDDQEVVSKQKGWLGQVESVNAQTVTINSSGQNRLVSITDQTTLTDSSKSIDLEDLEIDSFVSVVGQVDETDILSAANLEVIEEPATITTTSVLASVEEIDSPSDTLLVSNLDQAQPLLLTITTNTTITDKANPNTELDLEDLNPSDRLLVIYQPSTRNASVLNALIIHRTFQVAPLPIASPNAQNQ